MGTTCIKPKVRLYNKVRIEVCRNCHGAGAIHTVLNFDPHMPHQSMCECPVCAGSGTVRKKLKIEITIEPNVSKSNPGPRPHKNKTL